MREETGEGEEGREGRGEAGREGRTDGGRGEIPTGMKPRSKSQKERSSHTPSSSNTLSQKADLRGTWHRWICAIAGMRRSGGGGGGGGGSGGGEGGGGGGGVGGGGGDSGA